MIKDRPILFSAPMVRALLAGSKTQTRRALKRQPDYPIIIATDPHTNRYQIGEREQVTEAALLRASPYGQPGDRLWARETWAPHPDFALEVRRGVYRADPECEHDVERWRPSIHMPRWAGRILLEIVSVRVERLQEISDADIVAEGIDMEALAESQDRYDIVCKGSGASGRATERTAWRDLWESTGGDWDANLWCWAITFKRVAP